MNGPSQEEVRTPVDGPADGVEEPEVGVVVTCEGMNPPDEVSS